MVRQKYVELGVLVALAAAALWDGVHIVGQSQMRAAEAGGYEILLAVLLLGLVVVAWRQRIESDWGDSQGTRWALTAIAVLVAYAVVLPILGYTLSTLLVFITYIRVFGSYKWRSTLAFAFAASVGSAYLWASLAIMLPEGIFPWP